MTGDRPYPDTRAGSFPEPPRTVTDREGREVVVRRYESSDRDALESMYLDFDPADRAQGIPPADERRVHSWLDDVLGADSLNVVAAHGDQIVGHAMLVPENGASELAIFVHQDYQNAGIGTHLMETLLGHGAEHGVERVWLTVERWNEPAIRLYEKMGFETSDAQSFELEMSIGLSTTEEGDGETDSG